MTRSIVILGILVAAGASVGCISAQEELADEIVAVVDRAIILRSDVVSQLAIVAMQQGLSKEDLLAGQGEALFREILESLIQEELLVARAREDSVEVPREMVEERVRARLKEMKDEQGPASFNRRLQKEGLTEREVRDRLRKRIHKEGLRQMMYTRMVAEVSVTTRDVQIFRDRYQSTLPPVYSLSHIMVSPKVSDDREAEARMKAEGFLARARQGEDFAALAREFSEDPGSAPNGGDLGLFRRGDMVPEFDEVAFTLRPGEISNLVRSDFGYHFIKVEEIAGERVRARHILVGLQPSEEDLANAYQRAVLLNRRVEEGEEFAALARAESDHQESGANGGLLGTYTQDAPPPGFAEVVATLTLGDVSPPVRTEFGWHLVKVNDDLSELEELVRQSKIQDLFDRVLAETRDKLYVDVRI